MGKKKASSKQSSPEFQLNFDDALAKLQAIVTELEDGSIGLEESLEKFETGVGLLRTCYRVLENAEQKIEILTGMDADDIPATEDFDASATIDDARKTGSKRPKSRKKKTTGDDEGDDADGDTLF